MAAAGATGSSAAPKSGMARALYRLRAGALAAASPLLRLYRLRYRHLPTVKFEPIPEAQPLPLECYTDKLWYQAGEPVTVFLKASQPENHLRVERLLEPGHFEVRHQELVAASPQRTAPDPAENGCDWTATLTLPGTADWPTGYYRLVLHAAGAAESSCFTFLLQRPGPKKKIAVLAPVGTWLAYNPYGGKSLYHNELTQESVYFASALRPNPALQYADRCTLHATAVEAHIYHWLHLHFGADLYPDYFLEEPEKLREYQVLVLAYHCEYVSEKMYRGLRQLVEEQQKSLVSLGANQVYWQIRWQENYTRIECRKNATGFSDGSGPGGLWRHTAHPEDELLGVRFTDPGLATYAPYQVLQPGHWLFEGLELQPGQLFGRAGFDGLPICGDETDTTTPFSRLQTEVIARGFNAAEATDKFTVYQPAAPEWDGSGGGEIAFTPLSPKHAVLSTGSIHSGAGLDADPVFTRVVYNFLMRYSI